MEIKYRLALRPHHNHKEYWVCATCSIPRRLGKFHFHKKCGMCGSTRPSRLVIEHRVSDYKRYSLDHGARKKKLLAIVTEVAKELGVPRKKLLEEIHRPEPVTDTTEEWFVQDFTKERRWVGFMPYDPIAQFMPMAWRDEMAENVMLQVRVPKDLKGWFKDYCYREKVSMSEVVVAYLEFLRQRSTTNYKPEQI